ncbi:hypothetical protein GYB59_00610 [bacterium]|nr:hypothetical protein [bacterium]
MSKKEPDLTGFNYDTLRFTFLEQLRAKYGDDMRAIADHMGVDIKTVYNWREKFRLLRSASGNIP